MAEETRRGKNLAGKRVKRPTGKRSSREKNLAGKRPSGKRPVTDHRAMRCKDQNSDYILIKGYLKFLEFRYIRNNNN